MLLVSDEVKQLYRNDGTPAFVYLTIDNTEYTPRNVVSGSITITESFNSGDMFELSSVEKNSLEFKLINTDNSINDLLGKEVVAVHRLDVEGGTYDLPLGKYTIVDAVHDGDFIYKCIAYDDMLKFDRIIDDWWSALTFPITIKQLIVSLCTYCNVQYDLPDSFINSDFVITKKPTAFEGVKGSEVLGYIQEVIGAFLKVNRSGVLKLLGAYDTGLYPAIDLFPSEDLYPAAKYTYWQSDSAKKEEWNYSRIVSDLVIEDYEVASIDKVQVRNSEKDIGIIVGTGTNTYVIESNPLFYNVTDSTGRPAVEKIYNILHGITYHPFSVRVKACPYVEVGDWVRITTLKGKTALSPLFKRVMGGAKLTFDTLSCTGRETRVEQKSVNRSLKILNQRTHEVINTVEEFTSTVSEIEDEVNTHTTQITQNSNAITLQAQRTGYKNYLYNSNFSDIESPIKYWELNTGSTDTAGSVKYITDEDFILSDGKALNIKKTSTSGLFIRNQTIDLNGVNLNGKTVYLLFLIKINNSSKSSNYLISTVYATEDDVYWTALNSSWLNPNVGLGKYTRYRFTMPINEDKYIKKIRVYWPWCETSETADYEINNMCLLILDSSDPAPDFGTWSDLANNDIVSKINIAPEGIKIQSSKIELEGVATFIHNKGYITGDDVGASGTTVIDGGRITTHTIAVSKLAGNITNGNWKIDLDAGTFTIGNISANNITTGTLNSITSKFGSSSTYVTIKTNSSNDGVLFDGTGAGKVSFNTKGNFEVVNKDSSDYTANLFTLNNGSTSSISNLGNYFNNYNGNRISLSATSSVNNAYIYNNKPNSSDTGNIMTLSAGSSTSLTKFQNYNYASTEVANLIQAESTSSGNRIWLYNYQPNSTSAGNVIQLSSPASSKPQLILSNNQINSSIINSRLVMDDSITFTAQNWFAITLNGGDPQLRINGSQGYSGTKNGCTFLHGICIG